MTETTRSQLVATVTQHAPATRNGIECECGWGSDTYGRSPGEYGAHLADILGLNDDQPTGQPIPDNCPVCGKQVHGLAGDVLTGTVYQPCGHPLRA